MHMNTVLALLAIVGTLTAVVLALRWHRRSRTPAPSVSGAPDTESSSAPLSDWQQVAQRTHHSQIEALREWMGEDHELVQQLRSPDSESAEQLPPEAQQAHGRLV